MVIVAAICVAAGTWQIARLQGKAAAKSQLRHNAHAADRARRQRSCRSQDRGKNPSSHHIDFRTVTASGTYEAQHTALVRQRTVNDDDGFLVSTPLRTADGTFLVVRGFVSAASSTAVPTAPAPPSGPVTITAHVRPGEAKHDQAALLTPGQVESINPGDQTARLGEPVFAGYGELAAGQPGSAGLVAMPRPDLSNPAGGAVEPQHLAYIIQWYLFALLALAAPIAMVRAETRERHNRDTDEIDAEEHVAADASEEQLRAAKLADRYGRAVR